MKLDMKDYDPPKRRNHNESVEDEAARHGSFARIAGNRVRCTISGNACSANDGARGCSCVGCTVWRTREATVVRTFAPNLVLNLRGAQ